MPESQPNGEPPSPRWNWAAFLSDLDLLVYGGLGLALLLLIAFEIGRATWERGSALAFGLLVAFVGLTLFAGIRDLTRRRLSVPTRLFLLLWFACAVVVMILEFHG